jgi:hypothetical protein
LSPSGRPPRAFAVQVDASVWQEEVERFAPRSDARLVAERERRRAERSGISASVLLRCEAAGSDGTQLAGLVKAYLPISDGPPSERPFGMVFAAGVDSDGNVHLELVAFGNVTRARRPAACTSERTSVSTVAIPTSKGGCTRPPGFLASFWRVDDSRLAL